MFKVLPYEGYSFLGSLLQAATAQKHTLNLISVPYRRWKLGIWDPGLRGYLYISQMEHNTKVEARNHYLGHDRGCSWERAGCGNLLLRLRGNTKSVPIPLQHSCSRTPEACLRERSMGSRGCATGQAQGPTADSCASCMQLRGELCMVSGEAVSPDSIQQWSSRLRRRCYWSPLQLSIRSSARLYTDIVACTLMRCSKRAFPVRS